MLIKNVLEAILAVTLGFFVGFILIIMSLISDRMIDGEDTYLH